MKIAGIATDLTLDPFKKHGFNFVAPVIEEDDKLYIQRHKDETFYTLTDMIVEYADDDEDINDIINNFLEMSGKTLKDIGSMKNRKYKLVEYVPEFGDMDCLKRVDETIHVEPDLEIDPEKLILGVALDDDIFIGRPSFITQQLELLVGDNLTLEEVDILYRVYGMSGDFDKMAEMIDKALEMPIDMISFIDWQHRKYHHSIEVKLDELVNNKDKLKELTSEE